MNQDQLKFLELVVSNKGDIEQAKEDYKNILSGEYFQKAGIDNTDADFAAVIAQTVEKKLKALFPEIGSAFIEAGKQLGAKVVKRKGKE